MKSNDEYYKEWCGEHHTVNSGYPVHDSAEAVDFAEFYFKQRLDVILSKLYDKRLEYEYQIENHPEGSIERIVVDCQFNTIYEAECIVKAN